MKIEDICFRKKKSKKRKRSDEEATIQRGFFEWLSYKYPNLRKQCFAIPNGGSRMMLEAINLKRQGVTAGVPDVFCAIPIGFHGLFIEFKSSKGKLSNAQKEMFDILKHGGYKCISCWSMNEAIDSFERYIGGGDS